VCDPDYRSRIVGLLAPHRPLGVRLISVGAGNGYTEAALAAHGWQVLATDACDSALAHCRAKRLSTRRFRLLADSGLGGFDAVYCDGVLGHLWDPQSGSVPAWQALAALGHAGAICLVANDLADTDARADFGVRSVPAAQFYRPPAGRFATDAEATELWSVESQTIYEYLRTGSLRRRELIVARLLVHEGIEAKDPP
jgi:SAM-dependent methyltransferase